MKRCQELPGQELFQYVGEDGKRHKVRSDDVNAYLREATGQDFTAKDFHRRADETRRAESRHPIPCVRRLSHRLFSCRADATCRPRTIARYRQLCRPPAEEMGH